mgnify:CR=1 FL=1
MRTYLRDLCIRLACMLDPGADAIVRHRDDEPPMPPADDIRATTLYALNVRDPARAAIAMRRMRDHYGF